MKRDMGLIRKILLQVEDSIKTPLMNEGYSSEEVRYHNFLLVDAGLARGVNISDLSDSDPQYELTCLLGKAMNFLMQLEMKIIGKKQKKFFTLLAVFRFLC